MNFNNEDSHATFRFLWRNFDYGNDLSREDRDGIRSARHYRNTITAVGYCHRKVCRQVRNNDAGMAQATRSIASPARGSQ